MSLGAHLQDQAFTRFVEKAGIADVALWVDPDAERSLIAADLGGGVIKQRIARPGQETRWIWTLIVFRASGERFSFTALPRAKRTMSKRRAGRPEEDGGGIAGVR